MAAVPEQLDLTGDGGASEADWRELAARSGRGSDGDPVEALTSITYDGLRVRPLYTRHSGDVALPERLRVTHGAVGWDVRQRHAGPDPARTNAAVLADLRAGVTSLWLVLGAGGLAVEDLPRALDGVHLDLVPVALDAGTDTAAAAAALLTRCEQQGIDPAGITGTLGADPIGTCARTGADADLGALRTNTSLPHLCAATVDATVYHDAGAGDAVELAIATSVGVAYLRALTDGGLPIDAALDALEFRFAVTAEQFPSIAKLRAARRIWDRVAELCGASAERRGQRQHAVTSAAMMTRRGPWVNMLRTTVACFGAAIGGADTITVLPFDAAIGQPDDFARRIARNTHAILHDESSLARVVDAAGGSWYVESFTEALAEAAWDGFTTIERAGGALAALDGGTIGELVAVARDARADDIAHRRVPITGVSVFAFPDEAAVTRAPARSRSGGALDALRYAEPFEALRDRADAADPRPSVFLATLGPVTAYSERLSFATNLFQAGGIRVVAGGPAEFGDSGTSVACLCSSDQVYAREAAAAIESLAAAKHLWFAGEGAYDGVDGYVHTGCDALDAVRTTFDVLGVAP